MACSAQPGTQYPDSPKRDPVRFRTAIPIGIRNRPIDREVVDWLSTGMLMRIRNRLEFAGMLDLDKWACNLDGRQTVFCRRSTVRAL